MSDSADREFVRTALKVLSKKLTKQAEALDDVGQAQAATVVRQDISTIDAVMLPRLDEGGHGSFNENQRRLARTALGMLAHNLKAAASTNRGIGRDDWATACEEHATYIEDDLVEKLDEQVPLVEAVETPAS